MTPLHDNQKEDKRLASAFQNHIRETTFPCLGAKSALARGALRIVVCHDIASGWDDLDIHRELVVWSDSYQENPVGFRSLAFIFRQSQQLGEEEFENHMWSRIQSLADKDDWRGKGYDDSVSSDPEDPHFALSFGGAAYFAVGLHPGASRLARQFERPVMVFNLHDQFQRLRDAERYERMREVILDRDEKLAGTVNPMLARHGRGSAAAQYSGRHVGDAWECPFSDPRGTQT